MILDMKQIEYRHGMIKKGIRPKDLPVKVWRGAKISAEIMKAINEEDLINLGGIYGDKNIDIPVEYDRLRLVLTDDTVEIEVFNRGITLAMTEDEQIRRIHRVLCKLQNAN